MNPSANDTSITAEEAQVLIDAQARTIGQQQTRILLLEARAARWQAEGEELRAMLLMLREAKEDEAPVQAPRN